MKGLPFAPEDYDHTCVDSIRRTLKWLGLPFEFRENVQVGEKFLKEGKNVVATYDTFMCEGIRLPVFNFTKDSSYVEFNGPKFYSDGHIEFRITVGPNGYLRIGMSSDDVRDSGTLKRLYAYLESMFVSSDPEVRKLCQDGGVRIKQVIDRSSSARGSFIEHSVYAVFTYYSGVYNFVRYVEENFRWK